MLTLKPRMDHMGRPIDPFGASPNLIRQPSAEDLDAAHQLVSSARGGRSSLGGPNERPRIGDGHLPFLDGGSTDLHADQPATNGQPSLSGQVCRWEKYVSLTDRLDF
jgi:hypothetical protein